MKKIIIVVLVACLATSTAWLLLQEEPRVPISEEEAITKIRLHVAEVEKIPEENVHIDEIELRPPTKYEASILRNVSKEPPKLMWSSDAAIHMTMTGTAYCKVWLDAYTEEIVYGPSLFQIEIEGGLPDGGPVMLP